MLTQARREEKFLGLLDVLLPQAEAAGDTEVVALRNYGGYSQDGLGALRQALLDDARGTWASFIDDDDMVTGDYVAAVRDAIAGCPPAGFVALRMMVYEAGRPGASPVAGKPLTQAVAEAPPGAWVPGCGWADRVTRTGLHYGGWRNEEHAYIRDITHVNPVLTASARRAGFSQPARTESNQPSEDKGYAGRLRPLLSGCAQADIPRVLYLYRHDETDTVQSGPPLATPPSPAPVIASPAFRWHPASAGTGAAA